MMTAEIVNQAPIASSSELSTELAAVMSFLAVPTPESWLEAAHKHLDILLIDHAHCEKKAAATAMNLMFRYVEKPDLLKQLSQLAREELLHFSQVMEHLAHYQISYQHLSPARYAKRLHQGIRTQEPARLVDSLIVGALIEARSCERFAALTKVLDQPRLVRYYRFLLASESRHFQDYLALAQQYATEDIQARIEYFTTLEADLITSKDTDFRFHSGVPMSL